MTWTAARGNEKCGGCGASFKEGTAIALLTAKKFVRCVFCAGAPVDWDAVHAEIEARRAIQTGEEVVNIRQSFERVTPDLGLDALLKNFGIRGRKQSKPKPYAEVADDPAVARAGDDK